MAPRRQRKGRMRRAVTVATVAKAAGVSRAAVSFAYNAPDQISSDTRARILEVAEALGYVPDPIARLLNTRQAGVVGLLMVESIEAAFADPFTSAFVRGMGQMCDRHDLALTLLPPRLGSSALAVQSAIVDGVVTLGLTPDDTLLVALKRRHLPLVVVDGQSNPRWSSVLVDDEAGAYAAAAHLATLGHRRIGIIAFELPSGQRQVSYVTGQRLAGYERGLATAATPIAVTRAEAHSDAISGAQAMRELLARDELRPTAVLAMSDALALGAMSACEEFGLRIPDDISIIGFDNIPESALTTPPLTTVGQPIAAKAIKAMEVILRELQDGDPFPRIQEVLPTELIVRGSTGLV
jgi:DNA-binding LacI/PurR family transcriptional regulator